MNTYDVVQLNLDLSLIWLAHCSVKFNALGKELYIYTHKNFRIVKHHTSFRIFVHDVEIDQSSIFMQSPLAEFIMTTAMESDEIIRNHT